MARAENSSASGSLVRLVTEGWSFDGWSALDTGSSVLLVFRGLDLLLLCGIVDVAPRGCEIPREFKTQLACTSKSIRYVRNEKIR